MSDKELRILYMGTPEFAVTPLKKLYESGYNVVGVVTMPDKPIGRGQKMGESSVKKYAKSVDLPIYQPESLKDPQFTQLLESLMVDISIVVAFKMLPKAIWSMPKMGTFNLHTSLLPDYRGAAPINWAVINGDKRSGVTTFMIDDKIDTGDIILSKEVAIADSDTAGDLHDNLMFAGADLVVDTVAIINSGEFKLQKQSETEQMRPAPKIFKEDCKIDWSRDGESIRNQVRGLSPYPAAWSDFDGALGENQSMKIFEVSFEKSNHSTKIGEIITDGKKFAKVACSDGYITLLNIQLSGKKRMDIESFLRGSRLIKEV